MIIYATITTELLINKYIRYTSVRVAFLRYKASTRE